MNNSNTDCYDMYVRNYTSGADSSNEPVHVLCHASLPSGYIQLCHLVDEIAEKDVHYPQHQVEDVNHNVVRFDVEQWTVLRSQSLLRRPCGWQLPTLD